MTKIKNYIILGIVSILIVFGIVMSIKCSKLEKENIKLKVEHTTILDSIKIENEALNKEILLLNDNLANYEHKIDSLKQVKQRVIVQKEYIISDNITESVSLLKENIKCER